MWLPYQATDMMLPDAWTGQLNPRRNHMQDDIASARRRMLKLGGAALAMIPVIALSGKTYAKTNPSMRTALQYQGKPSGNKDCRGCAQFIPGKTADALGGCKLCPGDTEISPQGYCIAWIAAPKK
jgi:hypothetical protein